MILPDVNVLVYAHREDEVDHSRYRQWGEKIIQSSQTYASATTRGAVFAQD